MGTLLLLLSGFSSHLPTPCSSLLILDQARHINNPGKKTGFAPKRRKSFFGPIERSLMSAFDCTRFCDVASSIDGASSMSSRDTGISTYKWARATCLPVMAQWRPLGVFCSHQHLQRPPRCHIVCQGQTHIALGLYNGQKEGEMAKNG